MLLVELVRLGEFSADSGPVSSARLRSTASIASCRATTRCSRRSKGRSPSPGGEATVSTMRS